jgi:hypothetical protein
MLLGSEGYQEALIKALAKHFGARILILDSLMLCGVSYTLVPLLICSIRNLPYFAHSVSRNMQGFD